MSVSENCDIPDSGITTVSSCQDQYYRGFSLWAMRNVAIFMQSVSYNMVNDLCILFNTYPYCCSTILRSQMSTTLRLSALLRSYLLLYTEPIPTLALTHLHS